MNNIESSNMIVRIKMNRWSALREIGIWILGLSFLFVFLNPDPYMGIADYYIFFVAFICLSFIRSINFTIKKEDKKVLLLGTYMLFEVGVAAIQGVFSSGYFFSYLLFFLTLFQMMKWEYTTKELDRLFSFYIEAAFLVAVILFVQRYDFYGGGNTRHSIKLLSHEPFDPNFLAAYLVAPSIIAYSKMLNKFKMIYLIAFLVIFAGILYTSSRGATIGFVLGAGIVTFDFFKGKKKIRKIIILFMVLIIGFFIVEEYLPKTSLSRIVNVSSYQDTSNAKRLLDWKYGVEAFLKKPFFGYGIQGEMSIIQRVIGVKYISHNTFIALLLQFGIVGFGIFLFCLFKSLIKLSTLFCGLLI